WGLLAQGDNPVARSNVCPEANPPAEPSMHAFCYTVPDTDSKPLEFVIAGSGEAEEGKPTYEEAIVALGDTSPEGLARKAHHVLGEMERRLAGFGRGWDDCSAVQLYTVYDAYPVLAGEISQRRAWGDGLAWHWCRPPVVGIDYEMDCRRVGAELLLEG
ncbi:MAG: 2-amino-5-chloromuconate deaminase CnbZ, partial [Thermomicrobiales bacterium]